jgi:pyruvate dehydrogenase complex dehydrogenase (E1) component
VADESTRLAWKDYSVQLGVYSSGYGQLYMEPVDARLTDVVLQGRIKRDGFCRKALTKQAHFCSWMAKYKQLRQSWSAHDSVLRFYSMFGFQRVSDLAWRRAVIQAA